jgi:hypothetical protein
MTSRYTGFDAVGLKKHATVQANDRAVELELIRG